MINDNRVVTVSYPEVVHAATQIGEFSDMIHMYTLSAALRCPIRSYFPPATVNEFLSQPFSRKVTGRGVNMSVTPRAIIMWSQISAPRIASE
jgi:hypothetical protein